MPLETRPNAPLATPERPPGSGLWWDMRSGLSYWLPRGPLGKPDGTLLAAALAGLLSCITLVAIAGRTARVSGATPPSSWLGLLDTVRGPVPVVVVGAIELCAVVVLVLAWWCLLKAARRLRARVVFAVGVLWAAPLTLGPPLLSLDAYSYVAQGRLAALGIDPYLSPPAALYGWWLQGVDPFWRQSLSPYGPFAVLLQRIFAHTGNPVVVLVLLHLLAFACLGLVAVVIRHLAPSNQRSIVLLLTVLNPLVLLQLLGAAHWEALLVALLAAALLAWQRGHPEAAIALASTAAAVKLPGGFALAVLLMLHVFGSPQAGRLGRAATGALGAAAPWLVLSLVVPNALGFVEALTTPLNGFTVYAPTSLLAEGVSYAWGLTGGTAPFDLILSICRGGGLLLAAGVCCALLMTASRRPAGTTIGIGLLAVALLGPVLYPWYLAWGLVPLALAGRRHDRLLALLSSAMIFPALPGLEGLHQWFLALAPTWVLVSATLLIAALALTLVSRFGHLRESGQEISLLDAYDAAQWRIWLRLPNSRSRLGAVLRGTVLEAQARARAGGRSHPGSGPLEPAGMPESRLRTGAIHEEVAAPRAGVVVPKEFARLQSVDHRVVADAEASYAARKANPACAHALGVILDHSRQLAPAPPAPLALQSTQIKAPSG